jgi:drug/metabolite transporter (DMT)-like permease
LAEYAQGEKMKLQLSGFGFLLGYIVMVGVASFLEKFSMKQLNPYQVNFLMAIGMAVTAVPALWIKQGSLTVPTKALPLGAPIGLLMALGSICFVLALAKLPVGMAAAISTSYVLVVVLLSWFFLNETFTWIKTAGIALTIAGVALLSWQQK